MQEAYRLLALQDEGGAKQQAEYESRGERWGKSAVVLVLLSLTAFVTGSWLAMRALIWIFREGAFRYHCS